MHSQIAPRRVAAFIMLVSVALAAACSNGALTEPSRKISAHRASMDDDPSLCRSGYTIIDGHVICNP